MGSSMPKNKQGSASKKNEKESDAQAEDKKLVVDFIQFLHERVTNEKYTANQIEHVKAAIQSLENAFYITPQAQDHITDTVDEVFEPHLLETNKPIPEHLDPSLLEDSSESEYESFKEEEDGAEYISSDVLRFSDEEAETTTANQKAEKTPTPLPAIDTSRLPDSYLLDSDEEVPTPKALTPNATSKPIVTEQPSNSQINDKTTGEVEAGPSSETLKKEEKAKMEALVGKIKTLESRKSTTKGVKMLGNPFDKIVYDVEAVKADSSAQLTAKSKSPTPKAKSKSPVPKATSQFAAPENSKKEKSKSPVPKKEDEKPKVTDTKKPLSVEPYDPNNIVMEDEFLDSIRVDKVDTKKPEETKPVRITDDDDFLNSVRTVEDKVDPKRLQEIKNAARDNEFLDMVTTVEDRIDLKKVEAIRKKATAPAPKVPKPSSSVRHASSVSFFDDRTIDRLLANCEIVSADSGADVSDVHEFLDDMIDNGSTEALQYLPYTMTRNLYIDNYRQANSMKMRIARSLPKPRLNHLVNYWASKFSNFSELVLFFQYLNHHVQDCDEPLYYKTYQKIVKAVVEREPIFQGLLHLVRDIPLMCWLKFISRKDKNKDIVQINPELLNIQMFPLAQGVPTSVMYCLTQRDCWMVADLCPLFECLDDEEFYFQLLDFINDRPDLIILEADGDVPFPEMYVRKNDRISQKFFAYDYSLIDLSFVDKLYLRNDYIDSIRQFIPMA